MYVNKSKLNKTCEFVLINIALDNAHHMCWKEPEIPAALIRQMKPKAH